LPQSLFGKTENQAARSACRFVSDRTLPIPSEKIVNHVDALRQADGITQFRILTVIT
jgi:hypothetical protein